MTQDQLPYVLPAKSRDQQVNFLSRPAFQDMIVFLLLCTTSLGRRWFKKQPNHLKQVNGLVQVDDQEFTERKTKIPRRLRQDRDVILTHLAVAQN